LLAARVKADYFPNETVTEDDVEGAMFKAEDIFKACYPPTKASTP
jgi:hypothetical protein